MSVKPYFWPETIYDVEPDKLEATAELDKLEATAELDELEAPLSTLEVPKKLIKPIKPTIKRGQGRP